MAELELLTVAFNQPWLIAEQVRLLRKHLRDDFGLCVIDNSDPVRAAAIEDICWREHVGYLRSPSPKRMHHEALNFAAAYADERGFERYGFLDHDVFPMHSTTLLPRIDVAGFYGIGQTAPSGERYLWPGFSFFTRRWLDGRQLDFGGIPGADTGSANWRLFTLSDWANLAVAQPIHSYGTLRERDEHGLQSYGYECFGAFLHLTNGSGWKQVPAGRERLARDLVERL